MEHAERGVFDIRRGRAVHLTDGATATLIAAVDSLDAGGLAELRRLGGQPPRLVITGQRAAHLGLATDTAAPLTLEIDPDAPLDVYRALAGIHPPGATPDTVPGTYEPASALDRAALALTRAGRLLPAVVTVPLGTRHSTAVADALRSGHLLTVPAHEAVDLAGAPRIELASISEARVPLEHAESARFALFRETNGLREHVAVLIGERDAWPTPVPVRLHSACLTGDLFGSLRCDCGVQLRNSIRAIAERGGGILLYLAQEGRDIGLANKLRAYTLQDHGADTVEADCSLGFNGDERRYEAAVDMLRRLEVERVQLFTNNPAKLRALEQGGIQVVAREPVHGVVNDHNRHYLSTKAERAGHWLDDLLAGTGTKG